MDYLHPYLDACADVEAWRITALRATASYGITQSELKDLHDRVLEEVNLIVRTSGVKSNPAASQQDIKTLLSAMHLPK